MINISISPIAFTIGPISVAWYGIMVALAVLALVAWTLLQVRKGANLSYDTVLNVALVGIPSGVIFARLLHVVDNIVVAKLQPELALAGRVIDYTQYPEQIIGASGLTIYGAVLGAALGIWIFSKVRKTSFGYLADVLAPGIILAQAIGRVGCTLNGCCYGVETHALSAVIYTNPESYAHIGVPVHPTQIYEIIYNLIVFVVLVRLRGRFRPDGSLFLIYLGLYSAWRFGISFLRDGMPFLFGLQQAQVIALIILAVAIPLLALRTRWVKTDDGSE